MRLQDMTIDGHRMDMSKRPEYRVGVAELKAQLSSHLRAVRRGREIVVCDRDTPIARLMPLGGEGESLPVRVPVRALRDVVLPGSVARPVDSVAALLEERQRSR
jgi:antitoxin (DNA-binding transcriptional repressor) of toxin-antitoxin stability system